MERRVPERGDGPERRRDVRRLRVVDVANAVELADELDAVRNAGEALQRRGDRVVRDPGCPRGGRSRGGVLPVVPTEDARLGGKQVVS